MNRLGENTGKHTVREGAIEALRAARSPMRTSIRSDSEISLTPTKTIFIVIASSTGEFNITYTDIRMYAQTAKLCTLRALRQGT
jgi:hypothetical protein